MTERYVELHAASAFSFLEGASLPEELIERAVELNMPAMALLDRNGVYGAARFHTMRETEWGTSTCGRGDCGIELGPSSHATGVASPSPCGRTSAPAAAVHVPRRVSEPLSTDYPVQDARDDQSEGAATLDDLEAVLLPDWSA